MVLTSFICVYIRTLHIIYITNIFFLFVTFVDCRETWDGLWSGEDGESIKVKVNVCFLNEKFIIQYNKNMNVLSG